MSAVFSPCRKWRYTLTRAWGKRDLSLDDGESCPSCGDIYFTCADPALCLGEREPRTVAFIGLNPSTADETQNDPTVSRCVGYAKRWGYERMVMLNVFSYRATNPRRLAGLSLSTAIGPENHKHLMREAAAADLVVCAWGVHAHRWQSGQSTELLLRAMGLPLFVFGLTKAGHPKHPLYLRGDLLPQPWAACAICKWG